MICVGAYADYCLSANPFPATAVIDPSSPDVRVNGGIFNVDIFLEKIEELRRRTEQRVNLVYICGNEYDRGLGKSAIMIHHMRSLMGVEGATCAYVRCEEKDKHVDLARKAVEKWHGVGYLWRAFSLAFIDYCLSVGDVMLPVDSVRKLFEDHPAPPDRLPLTLYTHIRDIEGVVARLVSFLCTRLGADVRPLGILFGDYLSHPSQLPESMRGRKVDCMALYQSCLRLMGAYGYDRHYVFLDQFEDLVMGVSKSRLGGFALGMKILVSASESATIFVTLHPSSEQHLNDPKARDLTGVAPINATHRVNLLTLDTEPGKAVGLAEEYLRHFRDGESHYPSYPFEPELLLFIWYFNKGIIRNYLQQLYHALEYGVMSGCPEFTFEYAQGHQLEVLGREVTDRMMEEYNRWRGKAVASVKTGRNWAAAIKEFKSRTP